jgi:putative two-component system response regulator
MGLPEEKVEAIKMAALIHDIGKLHVPAEIINKVGILTESEFKWIKLHPQTGFRMLRNIGLSWPTDQIVLQHHERLNGTGYPDGLCGSEILLEARILSVADVVDAMAVSRPYRPALGVGAALDEIRQNESVLYDRQVVKACLGFFNKKGFEPTVLQANVLK